jgi:hypothetical protein
VLVMEIFAPKNIGFSSADLHDSALNDRRAAKQSEQLRLVVFA